MEVDLTILASLVIITGMVMVLEKNGVLSFQNGCDTPLKKYSTTETLVNRRKRVFNLLLLMIKENNDIKVKQAEYLLKVIDNRLSSLSIGNIFVYN